MLVTVEFPDDFVITGLVGIQIVNTAKVMRGSLASTECIASPGGWRFKVKFQVEERNMTMSDILSQTGDLVVRWGRDRRKRRYVRGKKRSWQSWGPCQQSQIRRLLPQAECDLLQATHVSWSAQPASNENHSVLSDSHFFGFREAASQRRTLENQPCPGPSTI